MVKTAVKIWLGISLLLLVLIGYGLLNTYVSLKYEVDESKTNGQIEEYLQDKEHLLKELAFLLKFGGGYVLVNVVLVGRLLVPRHNT